MKNSVLISICCILLLSGVQGQNRPKVGLVLSGGGARGFAHIGVLKMIDSLQIPIDCIAGTSIGGIMGALYSIGYSGKEIEQIARSVDWMEMFSDNPPRRSLNYLQKWDDGKYQIELGLKGVTPVIPSGLVVGQKASLMLSELTRSAETVTNFDQLPIPFRCVAIDLITGREVILKSGPLFRALRATMSIPSVFSPVDWGDSLLIDGGFLNNFPADVAEDMGAEIIIGVNIGNQLGKKEDLQSLVSVFNQTLVIIDYRRQQENFKKCDLIITPDLTSFVSMDFDQNSVNQIIDRGEEAAQANKENLASLIKQYGLSPLPESEEDSLSQKLTKIASFIIKGETYQPEEYFYQLLKSRPGQYINRDAFLQKIVRIRKTGIFEQIEAGFFPAGEDEVKIELRVTDREDPIIFGISIIGNDKLPFNFIYRLFGFNPNERLDKIKLNKRINEIYGLGYFENISYEIIPVKDRYVRLKIHVKEKSLRKLRIGLHYDNYHKIVVVTGIQATNFPLVGFRTDLSLQFAGLLNFNWMAAYPSRRLDLPIYPYISVNYKNVPVNIYSSDSGNKIAEYDNESFTAGTGLGVRLGSHGIFQLEYNQEYVSINPNIAGLDPAYFPSWDDELHKIKGELIIDLLDDVLLPRKGILFHAKYESSHKSLGSELEYYQFIVESELYKTFFRKHTVLFCGFYTNFLKDLPVYKFPLNGGPSSFVGLQNDQLVGEKYGYGKLAYRYEYKKDIFLKLIANAGFYNLPDIVGISKDRTLIGYGIGIKFLSIIGPFEFVISNGSRSINQWDKFRTRFYFSAGVKL